MTENQLVEFLYSMTGGIAIGLLYDLFRIKRRTVKTRVFFIHFEDIVFWTAALIIGLLTVYAANGGVLRGYILVGIVLGVITYFLLVSRIVIFLMTLILKFTGAIIEIVFRIISFPFRLLYRIIKKPSLFIINIVLKLINRIKKSIKQLVRFFSFNLKQGIKLISNSLKNSQNR